jgi:hypothetical protein
MDSLVSLRVADLARKLGVKSGPDAPPLLASYEKDLGLRLADVERYTLVYIGWGDKPVAIVRTTKPYDRDRVTATFAPAGVAPARIAGKECQVAEGPGTAFYFAGDRLFVVGPRDAVELCLKRPKGERPARLAGALAVAGEHDAVFWCRPVSLFQLPTLPFLSVPFPGLDSATATLDVGVELALDVRLHFADEAGARRGARVA